jgi:hypothetical protein
MAMVKAHRQVMKLLRAKEPLDTVRSRKPMIGQTSEILNVGKAPDHRHRIPRFPCCADRQKGLISRDSRSRALSSFQMCHGDSRRSIR